MSSDSSLLSAVTKRASQAELKRLQSITLCLVRSLTSLRTLDQESAEKEQAKEEKEKKKRKQQQQQQQQQNTIIKSVIWSSIAPRFVFLLAAHKLVRSADRGKTWKDFSVFASSSSSSQMIITASPSPSASTEEKKKSLEKQKQQKQLQQKQKQQQESKYPRLYVVASCSVTGNIAVAGSQSFVGISNVSTSSSSSSSSSGFTSLLTEPSKLFPKMMQQQQQQQQKSGDEDDDDDDDNEDEDQDRKSTAASTTGSTTNHQTFRHLVFNRTGTVLFAASSSCICACKLPDNSTCSASSPRWSVIARFTENTLSCMTLLSEFLQEDIFEIAGFSHNALQLLHVRAASSVSNNAFVVVRKLLIPHKLGNVMKCVSVPLFDRGEASCKSSSCRNFKWASHSWRPGLQQQQQQQQQAQRRFQKRYDYTVGVPISKAQTPPVVEFFRPSPSYYSRDEIEEELEEKETFCESFEKIGGGSNNNRRTSFFTGTAPRMFACYSTGGTVVSSDSTSWLWIWMAATSSNDDDDDDDDDDESSSSSSEEEEDDEGGKKKQQKKKKEKDTVFLYSTATNVTFLPLVESNCITDSCGLSVLGHGRSWMRASLNGVSTSADGGRTWTEPQLSCAVGGCSFDNSSHSLVTSRPAFALLPDLEGFSSNPTSTTSSSSSSSATSSSKTRSSSNNNSRQNRLTKNMMMVPHSWCLLPLPHQVECSLLLGITTLE